MKVLGEGSYDKLTRLFADAPELFATEDVLTALGAALQKQMKPTLYYPIYRIADILLKIAPSRLLAELTRRLTHNRSCGDEAALDILTRIDDPDALKVIVTYALETASPHATDAQRELNRRNYVAIWIKNHSIASVPDKTLQGITQLPDFTYTGYAPTQNSGDDPWLPTCTYDCSAFRDLGHRELERRRG